MDHPDAVRKLSPQEVRALYYKRAETIRGTTGLDVASWAALWMELIRTSGWGFMDVIQFIQSATGYDAQISVHLSIALSNNNLIWKAWFFVEFPDFVRDLGMKRESDRIPFPWLERSRQHFVKGHPHYNAEDKALFSKVIWRSCYMWAHMFRRQCGKYMLVHICDWVTLHIQAFPQALHNAYLPYFKDSGYYNLEDRNISVTEEGNTTVTFSMRLYDDPHPASRVERSVADLLRYDPTMETWLEISRSTPYLAYCMYISNMTEMRKKKRFSGEENVVTRYARLAEDIMDLVHDKYEYNFPVETIESFIRWYVSQLTPQLLAYLGKPQLDEPLHPLNDIEPLHLTEEEEEQWFEADEPFPPTESKVMSMLQRSVDLGLYARKTDTWQYLENLPLCPRRGEQGKYPSPQFLGTPASHPN